MPCGTFRHLPLWSVFFSFLKCHFAQRAFGIGRKLIAPLFVFCPNSDRCKQRHTSMKKTRASKTGRLADHGGGRTPYPFQIALSGLFPFWQCRLSFQSAASKHFPKEMNSCFPFSRQVLSLL
jgi:hypothetical protein